ncbi:MAG: acetoacetate--CoA ligase [Deltaproteobacteria bacterium]|nr:acetoacetate--CoA ligase [Deltaproteobacteria bacterium]MBW1923981.1 acetoacetate--CoA ligase [Deltaproteobacteria bacterium]MBW1948946.1 acetoacetate--CoA ligase [Deltaproteobacteria bacterium]MBW2007136.1 acetoacetate--CoA ligase [Deltaproteobacteria bacterium]MBW2102528.1 acetoacetate--CoA ligase [Deltaproteobacteria bacterium]
MPEKTVTEGTLLWEPSEQFKRESNMAKFMAWLGETRGKSFEDYASLWEWSVTELEEFWGAVWEYFEIRASRPYDKVLVERKMPRAQWFTGSRLNYAEHVFRRKTQERPALLFQSEFKPLSEVSWDELYRNVSSVAASLRDLGIRKGDRVVAYLPNIPQTVTAFLACASIGATWSSCSPDFGTRSVVDRFKQIEPRVLFAVDGYQYNGRAFDRSQAVSELRNALTSLEKTVFVPYLEDDVDLAGKAKAMKWEDLLGKEGELVFEQVPFDHPLWVVYSSGTTGLPKGLVHGHGGILLEFLKYLVLHNDVKPGNRFFWFSTTGWVMWNILQGSLLTGATPILYDGSPGFPDMEVLWKLAQEARMTLFGTSAAFITACMTEGLDPGAKYDLSALKAMGSTGSPLSPEGFRWVYEHVKPDIWLASVSGGTDPCSAFVGCAPILPVHAGELQCRCLGVKAESYDEEGNPLVDEVGELVISEPMPSMPLYLWNDEGDKRYQESYFEMYPGKWRHGDWIKITSRGSAVITGRSDSTLNRLGVRMGSSEIYGAIEDLPELVDSLVVGFPAPGREYYMPLFVVLKEGVQLDDALKKKINTRIRETLSPRHVPDDVFAIPDVPRTLNGKKLEVPVKKILSGIPVEKAVNIDSMENPGSIDYFVEMARKLKGA